MIKILRVKGESMTPTVKSGSFVFATILPYLFRKPKVGDIVVVRRGKDTKNLIKRIKKIQGGRYFVVGDNPKESTDSRTFGWITKKEIAGRVLAV
ncbi:nickel-type superoxide dismutase maturation protease [Candidatus Roizmanbacteria bacterium]|nr:nickel-type superoxide dismutase maturation protease [Candidatus Roizmanbacteria bacterium]